MNTISGNTHRLRDYWLKGHYINSSLPLPSKALVFKYCLVESILTVLTNLLP